MIVLFPKRETLFDLLDNNPAAKIGVTENSCSSCSTLPHRVGLLLLALELPACPALSRLDASGRLIVTPVIYTMSWNRAETLNSGEMKCVFSIEHCVSR